MLSPAGALTQSTHLSQMGQCSHETAEMTLDVSWGEKGCSQILPGPLGKVSQPVLQLLLCGVTDVAIDQVAQIPLQPKASRWEGDGEGREHTQPDLGSNPGSASARCVMLGKWFKLSEL